MRKIDEVLKTLNPEQKKAVQHSQGPAVVLAGAGSGKTRVLISRVFYLVLEKKVNPYQILLITFTNKAAKEMKERLGEIRVGFAGTFHSFCVRILRQWSDKIGLGRDFVIYDEDDQLALMKKIHKRLEIGKSYSPRFFLSVLSLAKNSGQQIEDFIYSRYNDFIAEKIIRVLQEFEKEKRRNNAVDFDDLLLLTVKLLSESREILEKLQRRYQYILIDEFQDTNKVQYELARLIGFSHKNIFVVGDFSQSIYSWRGAQIDNLRRLEKDFPETKTYYLERNYRSTRQILDFAYQVISQNKSHPVLKLHTDFEGDAEVEISEFENEEREAIFVAEKILDLNQEYKYQEFAVLYRTNAQSRYLEEVLIRYSLPYRLTGGVRFYERKEIKDILAYLRLVLNPAESVSRDRVMKLGKRRFQKFLAMLDKEKNLAERPTAEIMEKIFESTDYLKKYDEKIEEDFARLENIRELKSIAYEYPRLPEFLEHIALVESEYSEGEKKGRGGVHLMTLHQAKGLEFPVVFIVGLEEGLLPHSRSLDDEFALEEERRLFYVGITRAMERLFITYAKSRRIFGRISYSVVSRFLL